MQTFVEPKRQSDWLVEVALPLNGFHTEVVAAGADLATGDLITASGVVAIDHDDVIGIAMAPAPSGVNVAYLARGPAVVRADGLGYTPSEDITAAGVVAKLITLDIRTI